MASSFWNRHQILEKNSFWLILGMFLIVTIGGIVEMVPLFYLGSTIERVSGMRPYAPLELIGRNIYIREGCYNCHSQQIRALRDEIERYGHYSLAAESMYDHPFQWGSKRTGPDLARVGGKYSDDWHVAHLVRPRSVVPESIMPNYGFLMRQPVSDQDIADHLRANRRLGVPYTEEMIAEAKADIVRQTNPEAEGVEGFLARYPKANVRDFDGKPGISEMDAMVAYLQMMGTLVDFTKYEPTGEQLR